MLVINLFGGPGSGKSSTAAGVFNLLKKKGVNCEYVHEEAKEFTWEGRVKTLACQPYIFGKQMRDQWRLKGQVDIAITDSPILLSLAYVGPEWPESFKTYVVDQFNCFNNFNIFLRRSREYNHVGRSQTEMEAKKLDWKILEILLDTETKYSILDADETVETKIVDLIHRPLMERGV